MKNIVLIGFMGTGKTVIGKKLARELGRDFIDTDLRIRRREGRDIPEIFSKSGETYFRKIERKIVSELSRKKACVIATGGGAMIDPVNRRNLRQNGILIELEASPETILARAGGSNRPLLRQDPSLEKIESLLRTRRRGYTFSDFRIDTSHRKPSQLVRTIRNIISSDRPIGVDLGKQGYPIEVCDSLLSRIGERLVSMGVKGKIAIITNPRLRRLYGQRVIRSLKHAGFQCDTVIIPDGERYKNLKSVSLIYEQLIRRSFERNSTILALGGGVIGDLAGFAAATFLRGIGFIQVPTSLTAQVDASIGGKTGVDHARGKNLIGAFHQPKAVFIDPEVLRTLDQREFVSGLAEVIKYGVICDEDLFFYLEDNIEKILKKEPAALTYAIRRSCAIKADIVERDEREGGLRRILNYGHTYGHALETVSRYRSYLHGEAVSLGMIFAADLAKELGFSSRFVADRQKALLERAGLPVTLPKTRTADILKSMALDKKVALGRIHFVLARRIGDVTVKPVDKKAIKHTLRTGG